MRKSNGFSIFGGSLAQSAATGTAKAHFLRHRGPALGTKLASRAICAEILLRLHIEIAAVDLMTERTGKNYTPKRAGWLRIFVS